jgi:hypothetical protein
VAELSTAQHLAQTILVNASLGTFGTDMFCNKEPAEKSDTVPFVIVYDNGGFDPTLLSDNVVRNPTVTVRVIGMIGDAGYTASQTKIAEVADFMVSSFDETIGNTRYFGSYQQGDTRFVEYNEENRPIWSADFRLFKETV